MKDVKTVSDYNKREQRKYFRGQCFNNASLLLASGTFTIGDVYDLAQRLYDEGMKRNWIEFGEEQWQD